MRGVTGLLAAGLLLLTGCGNDSLESRDPNGYAACRTLAGALESGGDTLAILGGNFEAADRARRATTDAIRDTAQPIFDAEARQVLSSGDQEAPDTWIVDSQALTAACEDSGIDMPRP